MAVAVAVPAGIVALTLLMVGATACGGDDDGGGGGEAERAIEADAQERAEGVVLQLSDFPDGWRGTPPEEEDDGGEDFRECLGVDYSTVTIIGEADSDDFAMGSAEVTSDAAVWESEDDATTAMEEFETGMQSETVNECLKTFLEEGADSDAQLGDIEVGELSFTPPEGIDDAFAYQIAIPVDTEGLSATVYLDLIELREGDLLVGVQTLDVLSPFDSELREELLDTLALRATIQRSEPE
jgi:hypothetical protein